MTRLLFTATLLFALSFSVAAKTSFPFAGSTIELLDKKEGAALNATSDAYTKALTPFDLAIRLDMSTGATEKDYLQRAAAAVQDWPAAEAADLKRAFADVEAFLTSRKIKLPLPRAIQMIKTDGTEEFRAEGYTRGARIMLNTGAQPLTTHLVAHELFHVVSRADALLRDRVYAVFGFQPCNPIDLKPLTKASSINGITNPDCPVVQHFIELSDEGAPAAFTLLLYSKNAYKQGGGLEDYAALGLLQLTGTGAEKRVAIDDGAGIIRELGDVPELFRKIGTNTQYLLHPEEISAEHFAMLVAGEDAPEGKYLGEVEEALRNP